MSRVTLAVYDRAGTLIAEPVKWWTDSGLFLDELDDVGGFSVNIQADDSAIQAAAAPESGTWNDGVWNGGVWEGLGSVYTLAGHVLVVSLDAVPIWRGVIRQVTTREVAEDEAGRYLTFAGTGEAGRLDEIVVYPTGGLGRFPFSDDRTFDWTAPEFVDTGWDAVVVTAANYGETNENYGLPEGFPDGSAEWIWNIDSSGTVPGGIKYFRKSTTAASTGVREAWSAADDRNEVWVHGTSVLKSSDAPYDGRTTAVELVVSAGALCIAAKAENRNDLKAGLLFSLLTPLSDDVGSVIVKTDSTWKVKPESATLGMNAGEILIILRDEAIARGETAPAITFTKVLDSNGAPWEVAEQVTVPVGATYMDVLRQMVDLEMCDFRMSATGYTLNLYNAGGAGGSVIYTLGDGNLASLTWDSTPATSTALLVRWNRGYTDTEDASLVASHGRRTALLSLGGVASEDTAQSTAVSVITKYGVERTEISASIVPENAASEPYTKYDPGDHIVCPGPEGSVGQRVMAVGVGVDDTGNPTWEVHLNSSIAEVQKRQQIMLKRLANGNLGGRSQTSTIPYEPRSIQPREPDPVEFSQDRDGGIEAKESGPHTFNRDVRTREVRVDIEPTSTSGDVVVVAKKNGTTFATVTVAQGRTSSYVSVDKIFLQRVDVLTVETTSVGTGVTKITTNVVFA